METQDYGERIKIPRSEIVEQALRENPNGLTTKELAKRYFPEEYNLNFSWGEQVAANAIVELRKKLKEDPENDQELVATRGQVPEDKRIVIYTLRQKEPQQVEEAIKFEWEKIAILESMLELNGSRAILGGIAAQLNIPNFGDLNKSGAIDRMETPGISTKAKEEIVASRVEAVRWFTSLIDSDRDKYNQYINALGEEDTDAALALTQLEEIHVRLQEEGVKQGIARVADRLADPKTIERISEYKIGKTMFQEVKRTTEIPNINDLKD